QHMGYEITYEYHERLPDGRYNMEETKKVSQQIGDPFEDVSLDRCAAAIMRQMARRDVWILPNPDIYELKKTKVSVRETNGGIIIKNRKFTLDHTEGVLSEELAAQTPIQVSPHQERHNAVDLIDQGPMPVIRAAVPQADPNLPVGEIQEN